jgi:hypothetical protein
MFGVVPLPLDKHRVYCMDTFDLIRNIPAMTIQWIPRMIEAEISRACSEKNYFKFTILNELYTLPRSLDINKFEFLSTITCFWVARTQHRLFVKKVFYKFQAPYYKIWFFNLRARDGDVFASGYGTRWNVNGW